MVRMQQVSYTIRHKCSKAETEWIQAVGSGGINQQSAASRRNRGTGERNKLINRYIRGCEQRRSMRLGRNGKRVFFINKKKNIV